VAKIARQTGVLDLADGAEVICEWRRQEHVNADVWVMCLVTGLRKPADGKDPWAVADVLRAGGEGLIR